MSKIYRDKFGRNLWTLDSNGNVLLLEDDPAPVNLVAYGSEWVSRPGYISILYERESCPLCQAARGLAYNSMQRYIEAFFRNSGAPIVPDIKIDSLDIEVRAAGGDPSLGALKIGDTLFYNIGLDSEDSEDSEDGGQNEPEKA